MIDSERLSAEFARLAAIASPSLGEGDICRYLRTRLLQLGAEVLMDQAGAATGGEVGNLIARFAADGSDSPPLMLSVHMDMVEPSAGVVPLLKDGIFTSAGATVLGADDKAGIAEILEALAVIREGKIPHGPLEVVITIGEEIGLVGAKHLDYGLVTARRGFALDTSGTDRIILTAPGANKMRFEITGRESHAGIAPEKGISAIAVAASAVAAMHLGRIDFETTANIGTIHGGLATNIVARSVILEGEARSHDTAKLEQQTRHMIDCCTRAAEQHARDIDGVSCRPEFTCEVKADYPSMALTETAEVLHLAQRAAGRLGRTLEVRPGGGGSDANIFNAHGIETAIIGTGMCNVHSVEESVAVADMVRVAELVVEIIRLA